MAIEAMQTSEAVVSLTKVVSAKPKQVFTAWTEAKQIEQWFGPPGYTVTAVKMDARVDGEYELRMQSPDASDPIRSIVGRFTKVSAPTRLAFTWAWVDESGDAPDDGESLVTVEFHPHPDGTEVRLIHERLESEESRAAHEGGWAGSLEKLAGYFA